MKSKNMSIKFLRTHLHTRKRNKYEKMRETFYKDDDDNFSSE